MSISTTSPDFNRFLECCSRSIDDYLEEKRRLNYIAIAKSKKVRQIDLLAQTFKIKGQFVLNKEEVKMLEAELKSTYREYLLGLGYVTIKPFGIFGKKGLKVMFKPYNIID